MKKRSVHHSIDFGEKGAPNCDFEPQTGNQEQEMRAYRLSLKSLLNKSVTSLNKYQSTTDIIKNARQESNKSTV